MDVLNANKGEAIASIKAIIDIDAARAAHDDGSAKMSPLDYIDNGAKRADLVTSFVAKFKAAYSDERVQAWYTENTA